MASSLSRESEAGGGWLSRCWDLHHGRRLIVAEVEMVPGVYCSIPLFIVMNFPSCCWAVM